MRPNPTCVHQVTSADFDASPRRDLMGLWFWVNDVPARRAAMRILPGRCFPQGWPNLRNLAQSFGRKSLLEA
jgi:hypothetical protein